MLCEYYAVILECSPALARQHFTLSIEVITSNDAAKVRHFFDLYKISCVFSFIFYLFSVYISAIYHFAQVRNMGTICHGLNYRIILDSCDYFQNGNCQP